MMMTRFAAVKAAQRSLSRVPHTMTKLNSSIKPVSKVVTPKIQSEPYIFEIFDEDYESETQTLEEYLRPLHEAKKVSNNNECYALMKPLRKDDLFHKDLSQEQMIRILFPKAAPELVLSLSNVTAVFYGNMLQTIGNDIGMDKIDQVSKNFFYNLGKTLGKITKAATEGQYDLPKDARGITIALITAIYKASPEYKFQITHFNPDHCEIELKGDDRYLRVAKQMGFSEKLEWPVLHRFMEGIRDELKADIDVKSEMLVAEDSGKCHERFTMKKKLR